MVKYLFYMLITAVLTGSASAQWVPLHFQSFEDSVAPWTHSNGQAFPFGWGRQPSSLHIGWAPPDPEDWCLWIDSDAAGMAGTSDTAFSPIIAVDSCDPIKIKWGVGYEDFYSGADFSRMLYRLKTGGTWDAWAIGRTYATDAVKNDSILLSVLADSLQVAFYYSDGGAWAGWVAVDNVEVSGFITGVAGDSPIPLEYCGLKIVFNRPNPFGQSTTISYQLPASGRISLKVYNSAGQLVRILVEEPKAAGQHSVLWDGRDERGSRVSNGVYLYRLEAGGEAATGRMAIVR